MTANGTLTKEDFHIGCVVSDSAGRFGRMISSIRDDGMVSVRFVGGLIESVSWEGLLTYHDNAQIVVSDTGNIILAANLADA